VGTEEKTVRLRLYVTMHDPLGWVIHAVYLPVCPVSSVASWVGGVAFRIGMQRAAAGVSIELYMSDSGSISRRTSYSQVLSYLLRRTRYLFR
jgi:hypothetical protein